MKNILICNKCGQSAVALISGKSFCIKHLESEVILEKRRVLRANKKGKRKLSILARK